MLEIKGIDRANALAEWCRKHKGLNWSVDSTTALWGKYKFRIEDPALLTAAILRFA